MNKLFRKWLVWLPVLFFLVAYMVWLIRAYYDVAYMDQIQILAGNMNHMLNHDASLHDFYYRPPFLFLISNVLVYINCKLFAYNTMLENVVSGLILATIAFYFIKSNLTNFSRTFRLVFSFIASFIIFCFTKWELSLWGGGFSHYMVVLFSIICVVISHKYYIHGQSNASLDKYYIPLYLGLGVISILETTSYILPFLFALLIQLVLNYKLFKDKIDVKKWRIALGLTIALVVFSLVINYMFELYSISHPYDGYGKANINSTIGDSLKKLYTDPMFVIKFFLIANAGNLMDKDYYPATHYVMDLLPLLGLMMLVAYGYTIFLFIKRKKIEGVLSVNMITATLIFYAVVLLGRMHFGDVFYGSSSRYSAATFTGTLGVATFFILLLQQYKTLKPSQKILYSLPVLFIFICNLVVDRNEWRLAPYRKVFYKQMADNLKLNKNLESLLGYNAEIAGRARSVMIRNKLNIFKPQTRLENFTLTSENATGAGLYEVEKDQHGAFRWTDGNGIVLLPNLYNTVDSIKLKVNCRLKLVDSPIVVLNDNIQPYKTNKLGDGYEYFYAFDDQKVIYKAQLKNQPFVPKQVDSSSADTRTLGLIFESLTFSNSK